MSQLRLGLFRRVDATPFKVLEFGKVKELQKGQTAILEFATYKDVWGFRFEGFVRINEGEPPEAPTPRVEENLNDNDKIIIQELKEEEPVVPVTVTDEDKFTPPSEPPKDDYGPRSGCYSRPSSETINTLKGLTKQDFFIMKKAKAKEHLESIGADYSAVADEKWALVNFLKSLIKEL